MPNPPPPATNVMVAGVMVFLSCTSGIVGSGLCVFSRYQIIEVFSHSFRVTGGIRDFTDGEVFVGKGVLCCRIKTPEGCIAFFNTHVRTYTRFDSARSTAKRYSLHMCLCICPYMCVHECVYACVHVCVHVYVYVCMCVRIYVYVCMCVRIYVCVHVMCTVCTVCVCV